MDTDAIQAASDEEEARRFVLLQSSLAGDIRAIRSDVKFAELLEAHEVVPAMKISKRTGKPAYAFAKSDPFMEELLNHEDPAVVALAEARVGLKTSIVQTRIKSLATHAEANHGKFSVGLQYGAAHTHRLGGTGFAPKGALNITNFPRKGALNDAPVAPPGWLICNSDQSQIECRLVLWMAGEHQPLGMLARGEDLYSHFASIVFGRPIDKKKDPDQRFVGKVSVLSLGFGSGAPTFQNMVRVQGKQKLDDMFSQHVVKTYRQTYSGVPSLWRKLDGVLASMVAGEWVAPNPLPNHGITWVLGGDRPGFFTPNGLFVGYQGLTKRDGRYVYQRVNKSKSTEDAWIWGGTLAENLCQSLARAIIVPQQMRINEYLRVVIQVYDSVVTVIPEDQVDESCAFITSVMSQAPGWAKGLPLACEAGVGRSYASAKDGANQWFPGKFKDIYPSHQLVA